MENKLVVRYFINNGILLSPNVLNDDVKKRKEEIIKKCIEKGIFLYKGKIEPQISILRIPPKKEIHIEKEIRREANDFNFLRNKLSTKVEAISIGYAKKIQTNISIIGRINKIDNIYFAEDNSGIIELRLTTDFGLDVGDVVAMKGNTRNNIFFVESVEWPYVEATNYRDLTLHIHDNKIEVMENEFETKLPFIVSLIGIGDIIFLDNKMDVMKIIKSSIIKKNSYIFVLKNKVIAFIIFSDKNEETFFKKVRIIYIKKGKEIKITL